jgi:hypothetical protein
MVSDQQVMRLWRLRQKLSLEAAAAKSGMDSKTAWKYLRDRRLPSEMRQIVLPENTCSCMSTRPGVTYSDDTSTVLRASEEGIPLATRAIRSRAIATSGSAETPFFASMTWPHFNRRSYLGCANAQHSIMNRKSNVRMRRITETRL